jgi:O-antigen/teichoic acid export membrane protein
VKTQTRFVLRQSVIYSIGNILSKLSGVLLLPLYLHYISEEEFGVVTLFETIFQFILILSGLGVKSAFSRWFYDLKTQDERKRLFYTTYTFNLFTSLLSIILVGILLFLFSRSIFHYVISTRVLIYFCLGTLFRLMFDVPFNLLRLEQKAALQTKWFSLNILLVLAFSYYFLKFKGMGLEGIYLGQLMGHFFTLLPMLPLIWQNMGRTFEKNLLSKMIHYGLPLAVSSILTTILTLSDRHIINQYQNLSEVAGYSMGYKVSNLIQMVIVASFMTSYSNYYYKTMFTSESNAFFERILRYFIVLLSVGGLAIVLFAPEIIYLVSMGSAFFQASVPIVPVLILGLAFSGLRQLLTLPLNKHKKTRLISLIMVTSAVINIAGNLLLVPYIGKMGAALSTVVAQLFALVWFFYEVNKTESIQSSLPGNGLLLISWGALCLIAMQFLNLPLLSGWLLKFLLMVVFVIILFFTGHIKRDELREVRSIYRKIRGR